MSRVCIFKHTLYSTYVFFIGFRKFDRSANFFGSRENVTLVLFRNLLVKYRIN